MTRPHYVPQQMSDSRRPATPSVAEVAALVTLVVLAAAFACVTIGEVGDRSFPYGPACDLAVAVTATVMVWRRVRCARSAAMVGLAICAASLLLSSVALVAVIPAAAMAALLFDAQALTARRG
jgi:hypothetical protein